MMRPPCYPVILVLAFELLLPFVIEFRKSNIYGLSTRGLVSSSARTHARNESQKWLATAKKVCACVRVSLLFCVCIYMWNTISILGCCQMFGN